MFLGGYIPYFGGIVTTAIILLVTWATVGNVAVIALLALIAVRNVILGYGIRPALYSRTVSIHPALVLLVLPAGFQLAGVIGLFIAVPVTAVVFAVGRATLAIVEPDDPPVLPGMVPAWLDRLAQWSWRILAAFVLVAILVGIFVVRPAGRHADRAGDDHRRHRGTARRLAHEARLVTDAGRRARRSGAGSSRSSASSCWRSSRSCRRSAG